MGLFSELRLRRARNKKKNGSRSHKNAERFTPDISKGLDGAVVAQRREDNLVNIKPINRAKSYPRIIFENIFSFCNIVTLFLMLLLVCIGAADYALSSSIIIISMVIGIVQEIKAKQSVEKLSLTVESTCTVIRDGEKKEISTKELVLDDVYIAEAGAQVPVDSVIADGYVEVDESILTGESIPVKRTAGESIYAGSIVMEGQAVARADRVGKDCYIESIARAARKVERPKSRIFNSINNFIKVATVILAVLAVILIISERLAAQMDDWNSWKDTIITVSSSIIGMIPVGMFVMMSTALAVSVLRLSRHSALPQDLYSVEMLARVDTLLLDKTGTITSGDLEVVDIKTLTEPTVNLRDLMCTFTEATKDKKSTARALDRKFEGGNVLKFTDALSFSSARKYSAVTLEGGKSYLLGAPEYVTVLSEEAKEYLSGQSKLGRRSVLLAQFDGPISEAVPEKTVPLDIFILEDSLRTDVRSTLEWFYKNDVDVKIISGDNPETVSNIAAKTGVFNADKWVNCRGLSKEELEEKAEESVVFGRVSPDQKRDIVRCLQRKGRTVGMIGDGVNDVKALRESDCSISFGSANEVARNISRIILTDNNFSTLPTIVNEGRSVIGNIEKVSALYIMKNIAIMVLTLAFAIAGFVNPAISYPISTKQLLLLEFFVIGVPSLAFAMQKGNARRVTGNFMRNVLKSALPASLALILSVAIIYPLGMNGVFAAASETYVVSVTGMALTVTGFMCLLIISLPPDKFRLIVAAVMFAVSIAAIYADYYLIGSWLGPDETFLGMVPLESGADAGWLALAAAAGTVVNIAALLAGRYIERKYGDRLDERLLRLENRLHASREKRRERMKEKDEARKAEKQRREDAKNESKTE